MTNLRAKFSQDGDKVTFLRDAVAAGYGVVLYHIGISAAQVSVERVAMRVSQGGHDVPAEKLAARFPRILANPRAAIKEPPLVLVFDNDDLSRPFRRVAEFQQGERRMRGKTILLLAAEFDPWLKRSPETAFT